MTLHADASVSPARTVYDRGLRWLHWTMAGLIFLAIGLGVTAAWLPPGQQPRQGLLEFHKSLGFTILLLALVRIGWRLLVAEPAFRRPPGRLTRLASRAGHLALYVLMLWMPLSGYLYSGAGGYSLPFFGLFLWPRLLPRDPLLSHWGQYLHDRAAWVLGAVLALHLAAVIWHQFVRRDEVLSRMTGRTAAD